LQLCEGFLWPRDIIAIGGRAGDNRTEVREEAEEAKTLQTTFDAAWRQNALHGDAAAIKALTAAVLQPLFGFCFYRVGRNRHRCEEAVQETLLRALRDLEHYQPERACNNIFPWLTGLARNEIHRLLARERPVLSLEALWARMDKELLTVYARLESEPFAEELLKREETRELVNATMSQLPPRYREALEGKYVNGRSVRDLAAAWSISEKAAESQLTRARKAFRATFLALTRNLNVEMV
jgi:RNA polymerase sigma-70 factor, ECF subfamily